MLTGETVYLCRPAKKDLDEFLALNRASRPFHRGLATPPVTKEQYENFLKRSRRADTDCLFIRRLSDNSIVGSVCFSQIFRGGFQSAYLGYHIGAKYAHRGYMTEAIQLVLKYAFTELKLHRLEANIQPGNGPSIAVVKRAGFVLEGFSRGYLKIAGKWRDHERWAILVEDWKRRHKK